MTPREEFEINVRRILWDRFEVSIALSNIQALIDARVDAALRDHLDCVPLAEHWRESDTGELRTGFGDDVGECDSGCPVDALDRAGLIAVQVVPRCAAGHEWYGGNCPECGNLSPSPDFGPGERGDTTA